MWVIRKGDLINLEHVIYINKKVSSRVRAGDKHGIQFHFDTHPNDNQVWWFDSESKRDEQFNQIGSMLIS